MERLHRNRRNLHIPGRYIDPDKSRDMAPHQRIIDSGVESLDNSQVLQTINPLGNGRSRKPYLLSDFTGGGFAVLLQDIDDFNISIVQSDSSFAISSPNYNSIAH